MADKYVDNVLGSDGNSGNSPGAGNAYATIQKGADNTNGANGDCVFIKRNAGSPYQPSATIDIDTTPGNYTNNTWKQFIGYSDGGECDFPDRKSDLDEGDAYVEIDEQGVLRHGFDFAPSQYNIVFRNIHVKNVHDDKYAWYLLSATGTTNIVWQHCKCDCHRIINTDNVNSATGICMIRDCDFWPAAGKAGDCKMYDVKFIVMDSSLKVISGAGSSYFLLALNCKAQYLFPRTAFMAIGNTLYRTDGDGIYTGTETATMFVAYNNIIKGTASYKGIWRKAGSCLLDYNCLHGWGTNYDGCSAGPNDINVDPQFVDAGNGDFRPRNPAVLRGGKPDIADNPTQMGVVQQKYQFAERAKTTNRARLQIIR